LIAEERFGTVYRRGSRTARRNNMNPAIAKTTNVAHRDVL
jgi:hypothetical protein